MNDPQPRTVVVVPVRSLEGAKSRLGSVLDAEERAALVLRLLDRTLTAATTASSVAEVLVISPDETVLRRAARRGVRTIHQRAGGLNDGIAEASRGLRRGSRLLVLPGDLPRIDAQAIDELSRAADRSGPPAVVIVPDRHGRGTNALLLDPPAVILPAFGPDSERVHRARAVAAGASLVVLPSPLALDIDTPDDLLLAEREAPDALGVA